jgi:hypothetical protein
LDEEIILYKKIVFDLVISRDNDRGKTTVHVLQPYFDVYDKDKDEEDG